MVAPGGAELVKQPVDWLLSVTAVAGPAKILGIIAKTMPAITKRRLV